jgi:hypothetical protein
VIDRILRRLIDDGEHSIRQLESEGLSLTDISRVVSMMNRNSFKRRLPEIPSLGKEPIPEEIELVE